MSVSSVSSPLLSMYLVFTKTLIMKAVILVMVIGSLAAVSWLW